MTVEQKLCLKAQGFKEDVKAHNVSIINAVDNKLDAYKTGRYDGYIAGYHKCERELEAQIEKMKNCWNCKHDCKLLIARFGGCDFSGKKEKWEIKEND